MIRSLVAAAALAAPTLASAGEWLNSYAKAYERAKEADKPIFVYFTDSAADPQWRKPFDGLADAADRFILLVADKSNPESAGIFEAFEIAKPHGAVVVERTRQWQYFRTDRQLTAEEIKTVLTECRSASGRPESSVLRTVSHSRPVQSTSYESSTVRPSNYCPNCQRFR